MGVMDRLADYMTRAFAVGPAAIDPGIAAFGIDNTTYQPEAYVNYPATSNAVYSCINLRARAMASLPLHIYAVKPDGSRDEVTTGPAVALFQKVNPYWTFRRLVEMTSQSLDVWGECFWIKERSGRGRVGELWWARADRMTTFPDPEHYVSHFVYEANGQRIRFERDDVVWLRTANVADEFSGLSPLAAARLAADTAGAAGHSNYNIFRNGMQVAGIISPNGTTAATLTDEQVKTLQGQFDRRFKGTSNAHKVAILKFGVDIKQLALTPHDAEFLGMMRWALEDVARAFRVPVDKIGGKSTFENLEHSERQFWSDGILPDAAMIAAEITEQLLPDFGPNLVAEFDDSAIDVLHESETAAWERDAGRLDRGVLTINEWREEQGLPRVAWGDVVWLDSMKTPISGPDKPVAAIPPALAATAESEDTAETPQDDAPEATERAYTHAATRVAPYGSEDHRTLWQRAVERTEPWEGRVQAVVVEQFTAQRQSVLARLTGRSARLLEDAALEPFDRSRWIRTFRTAMRPVVAGIVEEAFDLAADDLGFGIAFDVTSPFVARAIETQVQRFAEQVNETTWNALRSAIAEGMSAGEGTDVIAERVEAVMRDRIRSDAETIARTETTRASTTGTEASWRDSGVVVGKTWVAAIDARTRPTHVEAHGQTVPLDGVFTVGGATGSGPGNMSSARESVNCRCTVVPVLEGEG